MQTRPRIFISAVSRELRSARQLVANTLLSLGYEAVWQDIFGTEQGDLRGMLRRQIDSCEGLIQLVGQCHGFEPPEPNAEFGRVSYTQYEALYARQREKKVWLLFLGDDFTPDPHDAEPEELRELQRAYRERVRATGALRHSPASTHELENSILRLRDDLAHLRRRGKQWAVLVLGLLVLIAGGVVWTKMGQRKQEETLATVKAQNEKLAGQNDRLLAALRELPRTLSQTAQAGQKEDDAARMARAYAALEEKLQLDKGTLEKELPKFAEQLLLRSDTSALDRASALFTTRKFAEAEASALQAKDKALAAAGKPVQDAIKALEIAGQSAQAQIQYPRALEHYRAAAALTSQERDPIEWASVQSDIASVLHSNGQYLESEAISRRVSAVLQRVLGPEHPNTLSSRMGLASVLWEQGKHAEAEQEHRAVLAIRQRVLGAEHPDTLMSRVDLAIALNGQGKHAEAEREHRAVLAIRERVLGAEHPDNMWNRDSLADALRAQGKGAEAEQEYRAVLATRERVLGAEHPDTLMSRMGLANALDIEGKHAEAEQEHRAVLAIRERVLGAEHPFTLESRMCLANALDSQGKNAEAETEYRAVLAIQERVLGPDYPGVFPNCYNLALCLKYQKKLKESLEFAIRAEVGLQKVWGTEHPNSKLAKRNREEIEAALNKQQADRK